MIYTLTLSPALDYMMRFSEIRAGRINRSSDVRFRAGGKGINVSLVLKRLNVASCCLGFVAGFTGAEILRLIRREGLNERLLTLPEGNSRINVKIKSREETDYNASGPAIPAPLIEELKEQIRCLQAGDMLIMSGNPPAGTDAGLYCELAGIAQANGAVVVADVSGRCLEEIVSIRPALIKPNQFELSELAGRTLNTIEEIAAFAGKLCCCGPRNVLVSLGANGAVLASADGALYCAAPQLEIVNTTGAGDSMVAGYVKMCCGRCPDEEMLRFAVACGSASAASEHLLSEAVLAGILPRVPQPIRIK